MDGLDRNGLILGETKNMPHVVEMRVKKAGTSLFDFPYVTPVTPGINGLITTFTDANGLLPGEVGYVGPTVQLGDAEGNALIYVPSDPVFQNGVTADGDGTTIDVTGYSKLGIEIIRTDVTTNTISFKSGVTLTNLFDHLASKIGTDGSITPEVADTATPSVFVHLDVADVKYVQCALSNLAGEGATVTVKGHLE